LVGVVLDGGRPRRLPGQDFLDDLLGVAESIANEGRSVPGGDVARGLAGRIVSAPSDGREEPPFVVLEDGFSRAVEPVAIARRPRRCGTGDEPLARRVGLERRRGRAPLDEPAFGVVARARVRRDVAQSVRRKRLAALGEERAILYVWRSITNAPPLPVEHLGRSLLDAGEREAIVGDPDFPNVR